MKLSRRRDDPATPPPSAPPPSAPGPSASATSAPSRALTAGQRDYEGKRAAKAGVSLEKWLDQKAKQAAATAPRPAKPVRKRGLLSRLLDKAHEPLKKP